MKMWEEDAERDRGAWLRTRGWWTALHNSVAWFCGAMVLFADADESHINFTV
jgi:hypothetical protein